MTFLSTLSILVLATFSSTSSQGTQTPTTPTLLPPPAAKYWALGTQSFGRILDSDGIVFCRLRARTDTRGVSLTWSWMPNHPAYEPNLSKGGKYTSTMWPTSVSGSMGLKCFVAGVGLANHHPSIESWTFAAPERTITGTAEDPVYSLKPGRRISTSVVWSSDQESDLVSLTSALPFLNSQEKVAVFFPVRKKLSILDTLTGTLSDIAVATPSGGGGLHIPNLLDDYSRLRVLDHLTMGYLYVLTKGLSSDPSMVIIDVDRDGHIDVGTDTFVDADAQTWETMGWGNPDSFVKHY